MDWQAFVEAMRAQSRNRRAGNRNSSAAMLTAHGVRYESRNHGAHLIVKHGDMTADFWPGTGKYQVRGSGRHKRGVFNLLRDLGVEVIA